MRKSSDHPLAAYLLNNILYRAKNIQNITEVEILLSGCY
jgi:hypothetical protein